MTVTTFFIILLILVWLIADIILAIDVLTAKSSTAHTIIAMFWFGWVISIPYLIYKIVKILNYRTN